MDQILQNMMKGLILHFLHQETVEQAIDQGRKAGVPRELFESLPGMMFEITSAACAVQMGEQTLDNMADQITARAFSSGNVEDFSRNDALKMLEMALGFIEELYRKVGADRPLPAMTEPWFRYQMEMPTCHSSGAQKAAPAEDYVRRNSASNQ